MPKTAHQILTAMAAGKRYTHDEIDTLIADGADWIDHADTWVTRLTAIAEYECELESEGLDNITVPVDPADKSQGVTYPLAAVADAIETIKAAVDVANEIKESLTDLREEWETFTGYTKTWLDEDADAEDKAEARNEMEGIADELNTHIGNLDDYGIDLDVEP